MPNIYSITCSSSQEHDKLLMRTIFEIVKRKSQLEWDYREEGDADVVIFDYDSPPQNNHYHKNPHLVIGYSKTQKNADKLLFNLAKPVRTRDLLELLSHIEQHIICYQDAFFEQATNPFDINSLTIQPYIPDIPKAHTKAEPKIESKTQQHNDYHAIDKIAQLMCENPTSVLRFEFEQYRIYVDSKQRVVYSQQNLPDINQYHLGQLINGGIIDQIPYGVNKVATLTDFLFYLTLSEQPARLISKLPNHGEFQLTHWPNLASCRNAKQLIRLAAYFSKRRSTLKQAAYELSVNLDQLNGFINATYCQGFVSYSLPEGVKIAHTAAPSSTNQTNKNNSLGSLFGRIRQKFGI